jgi:hypothetical protein
MNMKFRTVQKHTDLQHIKVGPFQVRQPLPSATAKSVSPFLLLHHAGPSVHKPGEIKMRLSPHPHRGFEPVTFLFQGKIHHKDSAGNEGFLESGDVQWMTAGSGIIHSEGPSEAFATEGGTMELVQLWVNLPRAAKMTAPKYQDIKSATMPVIEEGGFQLKIVAGDWNGLKGPATTFSPVSAAMVTFTEGAAIRLPFPANHHILLYVLEGTIGAAGATFEAGNLAVFAEDGDGIALQSYQSGKLLLLAGEPINEPVVSHGPFVKNYPGEIRQAILDYEEGKMGILVS